MVFRQNVLHFAAAMKPSVGYLPYGSTWLGVELLVATLREKIFPTNPKRKEQYDRQFNIVINNRPV